MESEMGVIFLGSMKVENVHELQVSWEYRFILT